MIPAFNEASTIGEVLERIGALELDAHVIVVDDGSTDDTAAIAEAAGATVIRQENQGKGAAIRTAIGAIEGEIAVIQDADMEYDPAEVPDLIEPIVRGVADVVYGSRLRGGKPQRAYLFWHLVGNRFLSLLTCVLYNTTLSDMEYDPADVPELIEPIVRGAADVVFGSRLRGGKPQRAFLFWHLVGNRFLSLVTNALFNTTLSDMETGYKAFRSDVLRSLDLRENRFGIEPEITAKVCKRRLRIYELPISYYGRSYDEGKKITWRDGFRAVWVLLRVRLSR